MNRKGVRRSAIACVLCGSTTHNTTAVCFSCVDAAKLGRSMKGVVGSGEFEVARIDLCIEGWQASDAEIADVSDFQKPSVYGEIVKLLLKLVGAEPAARGIAQTIDTIIGQSDKRRESYPGLYVIRKGAAEVLHELARLIRVCAALEKRSGKASGEQLLVRIAQGDLTVDQIDGLRSKS